MDNVEIELQELCAWEGFKFNNCGGGHLQVIGRCIVNYWPHSKRRMAQITEEMGISGCTPADVIRMAKEIREMSYDNTNSGAVFKNDKKTTEKQPDRTGSCEIACPGCGQVTEMWVSGWVKKSKAGQQYMSLAFTAKEEQNTSPKPEDDFDDDIPF